MTRWILGFIFVATVMLLSAPVAAAEPVLGLQPLQYIESLAKGERKKAYVDVTNPSAQPISVEFNVQGFKQIDDKGTLSFFDDERINSGILLDYKEREIPAGKTLRLFFIVDGTKLPVGDVFAAIFAQTKPLQEVMLPSVRVGTLLILTNDTLGARQARVESLTAPLLQLGNSISGEARIKNTAPPSSASGFFPEITLSVWPFGSTRTIKGPLVYAGNTRTVEFDLPSNQVGIYRISASYGSSHQDRWVIAVTGIWRWMLPLILLMSIGGFLLYKTTHRRRDNSGK